MKFLKKGDVVRRTSHVVWNGMKKGDTDVVVKEGPVTGHVTLKKYGINHDILSLELVRDTKSKPKPKGKRKRNLYSFHIRADSQIDFAMIKAELSPSKPLAIVRVGKYAYAVFHPTLAYKARLLDPEDKTYFRLVSYLNKFPVSSIGTVVNMVREIRYAPYPEDLSEQRTAEVEVFEL